MTKKIIIGIIVVVVAAAIIILVILNSAKKQERPKMPPSPNEPAKAESNTPAQPSLEQLRQQRCAATLTELDRPYQEKIASLNEALRKAQQEKNQQEVNQISDQIKFLEQRRISLFTPQGTPRTRPDAQKRNLAERMKKAVTEPNQPITSQ